MFVYVNLMLICHCVQNLHTSVSQYALQSDTSSHVSTVNESGFISLDQPSHVFRCVQFPNEFLHHLLSTDSIMNFYNIVIDLSLYDTHSRIQLVPESNRPVPENWYQYLVLHCLKLRRQVLFFCNKTSSSDRIYIGTIFFGRVFIWYQKFCFQMHLVPLSYQAYQRLVP